nr:hypothetical protein [Jiangella alkaliphila]
MTATTEDSSDPIVAWPGRLTALNTPPVPASAHDTSQAARSRASMYWIGRSAGPGDQRGVAERAHRGQLAAGLLLAVVPVLRGG